MGISFPDSGCVLEVRHSCSTEKLTGCAIVLAVDVELHTRGVLPGRICAAFSVPSFAIGAETYAVARASIGAHPAWADGTAHAHNTGLVVAWRVKLVWVGCVRRQVAISAVRQKAPGRSESGEQRGGEE